MTMLREDKKATIDQLAGQLRRVWQAEASRLRFRATFQTWRERFPALEPFDDVDDLITWFQNKKIKYPEKNPVALALCLLAQGEEAASTLLLFLFIPAFEKSLWKLSDPSPVDEVFSTLVAGFTEAMMTMTPETPKPSGKPINKARGAGLSLKRDAIRELERSFSLEKIAEVNLETLGIEDDPANSDPRIKSEFDLIDLAIAQKPPVLNEREADFARALVMGFEVERIAQVLGMTLSAAHETRRRMKHRLKDFIEEREVRARRNV